MSTQAETIPADCDEEQDMSSLYTRVDFKNKSRQKVIVKRASDKIEFMIPELSTIADTPAEVRNSDSNLYATLDDTSSPHQTLYNSAENIPANMNDQPETPTQNGDKANTNLFRNNTGPITKIRAPPPAIPPPYRREEMDTPRSHVILEENSPTMRRTKSIGSSPLFKAAVSSEKKMEDELLGGKGNKSIKNILFHSFKQQKEPNPISKPGTAPTQPFRPPKPDTKSPVPGPSLKPQPLRHSPPTESPPLPSDSRLITPESSPSPISPFIPLTPVSSPPNPLDTPPSTPLRPMLKNHSMPSLGKTNVTPAPKKQVPLPVSPATSPLAKKHPLRLPPPPPSRSLTLPRLTMNSKEPTNTSTVEPTDSDDATNTTTISKSTSIGDYTVLIPLTQEDNAQIEEQSIVKTSPPPSPPTRENNVTPPLQYETSSYTVLNLEDIETLTPDKASSFISSNNDALSFKRTASLPDELDSQTEPVKSKMNPPKKPPRKPQIFPYATPPDSEYSVFSSCESGLESMAESHTMTSPSKNPQTLQNTLTPISKTLTLPCHGSRSLPANPSAYRNRAHSHNVANQINAILSPLDESENATTLGTTTSEGSKLKTIGSHSNDGGVINRVFQFSKKFRSKDHSENASVGISKPIPVSQTAKKLVGMNPMLISECVAYLREPKSLREEGIFRIPGDLNQINFYLKQYDYSIKTNLDEELDPNTIASVLKSHVRDKGGFVPKKESTDLFAAARQKNIPEMSNIILTLPTENQKMLKEIFFLFKEVTLHFKENKMSAGTIATSCGLSIFPLLNAGNANLMLKSMIDNADKLFPE